MAFALMINIYMFLDMRIFIGFIFAPGTQTLHNTSNQSASMISTTEIKMNCRVHQAYRIFLLTFRLIIVSSIMTTKLIHEIKLALIKLQVSMINYLIA